MNTLFKLFDTLNDQVANITSLSVVMGDFDYENISTEIMEGYMASLINHVHQANDSCQEIQEFFSTHAEQLRNL